ncbi:MAG: toll/interleukin-1 receptor domain-containing protein [Sphingomonas bacterium]|nr:toll/interleukin-1 receptor domain-containing protein [Sphingomonas bacterium]
MGGPQGRIGLGTLAMTAPHYLAFISYSHADSATANWLHRSLESYRVPAKLVGRETHLGPVPRRLLPIFKDREELAASGNLSDGLRNSLAAARSLIVIASPAAAGSRWVNEEVRAYKQMHGEAQVLVVIAAGEPGASATPGREAEECFPPAVRYRIGEDGTIGTEVAEPIAADLREHGDGRRLAMLKLVAGLTGLRLDDLVRREAQRRAQRMRWIAIVATVIALIMLVLTIVAVRARGEAERQRAEAERQRAQADGLVEFMLTDLRKKLEPVGRLDALDVVGQRALAYYAAQQPGSLDADALGRRSRALHLVGEVRNVRGDSEGALRAFRQAAATTAELLARSPDDGQRIFDQAQSVFWVGLIAYQRGLGTEAERNFRDYKRLADRLVTIDPANADWRMEVSYAETNLGTMMIDRGRYREAEQAFLRGLRVVEERLARKPNDPAAMIEVGTSLSWVGRAQEDQEDVDAAIATYRREIEMYRQALARDPRNMLAKRATIVARTSIGRKELARGDVTAALEPFRIAVRESAEMLRLEPANGAWRLASIKAQTNLSDALRFSGDASAAARAYADAQKSLDVLSASDRTNVDWNVSMQSFLDLLGANLAQSSGSNELAGRLATRGVARLQPVARTNDEDNSYILASLSLIAGDAAVRLNRKDEALTAWRRASTMIGASTDQKSLKLAVRYAADRRLGQSAKARSIAALLDKRGFRHPFYIRERNR